MSSNEWCKGFEDALELAYVCVKESKTIPEALRRIEKYMGSAKSIKYEKIKVELGISDSLQS
ncbi:MAG: hypothetical protein NO515_07850 [Candidatus Methanomethylicia archaeon]|nr:hypothetical protein [Candidatus Methanomethylicia archaeon]